MEKVLVTYIFLVMLLSANLEKFGESERRCCERLVKAEASDDYRGLFAYRDLCAYLEDATALEAETSYNQRAKASRLSSK